MKRQFGSLLSRTLGRSTSLSPLEHEITRTLVDQLPPNLRAVATQQFGAYKLVQREVDGRALNFYFGAGSQKPEERGLPKFEQLTNEAMLARITLRVGKQTEPIHAVLTSVGGRAFSVTLSRSPTREEHQMSVQVEASVPSWRGTLRCNGEA